MWKKYLQVLKLARKPDGREFWQYTKLVFLGIALLGVIAFTIKMIFGLFIVP
jgi:protein transport protein SEC61 subunit gamma-like protein